MRTLGRRGAILVLAAVIAAWASESTGDAVTATEVGPVWQQRLTEARRLAADGRNYLLIVRPGQDGAGATGGVQVFHNNADPVCYTYMVPGQWLSGAAANTYRSQDGHAVAGVRLLMPADLAGMDGKTLVERAATRLTREYEKELGQTLRDAELVPFQSRRAGAWKWTANPTKPGDSPVAGAINILVDLTPTAVVQIAVSGTQNDEELARTIVEGFQTTSDSECYWPLLERMLKTASRE